MSAIDKQIDVNVSAADAWDALHDVSGYPDWIDGVALAYPEGVHRAHLDVEAGAGRRRLILVFSDEPDTKVMRWSILEGADLRGTFTVLARDGDLARVQAHVGYTPESAHAAFGGPTGLAQADAARNLVQHCLDRLKTHTER